MIKVPLDRSPKNNVFQVRLTFGFIALSESITTPDRYAPHSAIICPSTVPNRVGSVRCWDRSGLRVLQHVDGDSYSQTNYIGLCGLTALSSEGGLPSVGN